MRYELNDHDWAAIAEPKSVSESMRVWEFLHLNPYGKIAWQALNQRSVAGRRKYLDTVIRMAREERSQ